MYTGICTKDINTIPVAHSCFLIILLLVLRPYTYMKFVKIGHQNLFH